MQRLDVSGAVRPIYGSLGVKRLIGTVDYPTVGEVSYKPMSLQMWGLFTCTCTPLHTHAHAHT